MERVINDPERVYREEIREVYTMGLFLAKQKYRFIRLAYMVFIMGLVASGISLVVSLGVSGGAGAEGASIIGPVPGAGSGFGAR